MPDRQLTQSNVKLFKTASTFRRDDFAKFLKIKRSEAPASDKAMFQFGYKKIARLRDGGVVSETLARAFTMFALEIRDQKTDFAKEVGNNPKFDYGWNRDLENKSLEEAMEALFIIAQTTAFSGMFQQFVQRSINVIRQAALDASLRRKIFRLNETHVWPNDEEDAAATCHRAHLTAGSHFVEPASLRYMLTDKQRFELAIKHWPFTFAFEDLEVLYRRWYEINKYSHVWAVKKNAKASDPPWSVRISNLTTLPIAESTYLKLRAGHLGFSDLTDESLFQTPTTYFFIVMAAENPEVTVGRAFKPLAEMSCMLNQLARFVPPVGHDNHRGNLHLLTFGGNKETTKTLQSKHFKQLADCLKDSKPSNQLPLFELKIDNSFALSAVKDAVYAYQLHLNSIGDLPME